MATVDTIHDHGYELFPDLQLSAKEFYYMLESMIKAFQYPNVVCQPETLKEGGIFSAKREYLCIAWGKHKFLVCASPFGKSFFISWWHQEGANTSANIASKFGAMGRAMANSMENKTFFEIDNQIMFINCISGIIKEAIDKIKLDKGFTQKTQVLN